MNQFEAKQQFKDALKQFTSLIKDNENDDNSTPILNEVALFIKENEQWVENFSFNYRDDLEEIAKLEKRYLFEINYGITGSEYRGVTPLSLNQYKHLMKHRYDTWDSLTKSDISTINVRMQKLASMLTLCKTALRYKKTQPGDVPPEIKEIFDYAYKRTSQDALQYVQDARKSISSNNFVNQIRHQTDLITCMDSYVAKPNSSETCLAMTNMAATIMEEKNSTIKNIYHGSFMILAGVAAATYTASILVIAAVLLAWDVIPGAIKEMEPANKKIAVGAARILSPLLPGLHANGEIEKQIRTETWSKRKSIFAKPKPIDLPKTKQAKTRNKENDDPQIELTVRKPSKK